MRKLILTIAAVLTIVAASFASVAAQKKSGMEKLPKTREITIYVYQKPAETSGEFHGKIVPVRRKIIDYKPLDAALKLLLRGANKDEQNRNLTNFIFGLNFYSVRVRNKTAQINFKFDNPEIALESWEGGGFDHENFVKAVSRTASQFPGVERVSICVDGMKNYANYDRTSKCPFPMFPPAPPRAVPPGEVWDVEIYLNHRDAPVLPMGVRDALPVKRRVKAADFLNKTLKAFDAGATDAERKQGWNSATYGARFVSARIKNKKAFVNFTMPAGAKFPGRFEPLEFKFAVEDTVLQFWNEIDEIEICLNGISDFYADYPERIPCEQEQK
ncbi:MAG TPA: GerMN domain-containing protein [Pyrinomonadaceae bacterium]|jgi:hypothetical protein